MAKRDTRILSAIRHKFSRRHKRTIPDPLRRLALSGLDKGHTAGEIADAAGISRQAVVNWRRRAEVKPTQPPPVELKVIETLAEVSVAVPMARITLRSGAVVELPASVFDMGWLIVLNGGAT